MDSGLFNGAAYCNNNGEVEMVDLTLKLGLPYEAKNPSHLRQHVNHVPTTPDLANFNLGGPYTASQAAPTFSYAMMMMGGGRAATNNYGMGGGNYGMRGGGVAANNYGMGGGNYGMRGGGAATNNYGIRGGNYGMTGGGLATNNYEIGGGRAATNNYGIGGGRAATNNYGIGGGQAAINHYGMINRMGNVGMGNIGSNLLGGQNLNSWAYDMGSSSTDGILRHHQQYATGIPAYQNINGGLTLPPFQPHSLTSYTLLDCSPFKARQTGKSSSVARRPRNGNNINPHRRCTNYNCNTNDTPMWRKGPLGPKSLCNACGIKYRKEAEKRKAKEAAKDSKA